MEVLGTECSFRERRADEAARSVVAWLKCEFMRPRVGEEFDAVVTGVTDFGLFVQLKSLQVDGLVHVTALPADYFHFHERDRTLVGERTRQRFSIGDELRVRLVRVDSTERKIDFEHVAKTAGLTITRAGVAGSRPRGTSDGIARLRPARRTRRACTSAEGRSAARDRRLRATTPVSGSCASSRRRRASRRFRRAPRRSTARPAALSTRAWWRKSARARRSTRIRSSTS